MEILCCHLKIATALVQKVSRGDDTLLAEMEVAKVARHAVNGEATFRTGCAHLSGQQSRPTVVEAALSRLGDLTDHYGKAWSEISQCSAQVSALALV